MAGFNEVRSKSVVLAQTNIDTDQIIPARFLSTTERAGLGKNAFNDWRWQADGSPNPAFPFNQPENIGRSILLAGRNFGCGSSREHAVWGMLQYGIRGIVGSSYGAIFADNAANNGLLLLSLPLEQVAALMAGLDEGAGDMTVDLDAQRIEMGAYAAGFDIDPATRQALMLGLDRIGETLTHADRIRVFEKAYLGRKPWLMGADSDEY